MRKGWLLVHLLAFTLVGGCLGQRPILPSLPSPRLVLVSQSSAHSSEPPEKGWNYALPHLTPLKRLDPLGQERALWQILSLVVTQDFPIAPCLSAR